LKNQLWGLSCLSTGTVLAPLFFQPRDILTIIGGYIVGLTLPLAATISVASNFILLNVMSVIGMVTGTVFMRNTALPFLLRRRYADRKIPLSSISALNVTFGSTLLTSLCMLLGVNGFVYYVQKCVEHKESRKKPKWMLFDGTDAVTNGLLIAGGVGFVFVSIFRKIVKYLFGQKKHYTEEKKREGLEIFRLLLE